MEDRTSIRKTTEGRDDNRVQDMEEESSDEESHEPKSTPAIQPPMPPIPDKVVVKKYDPKQGTKIIHILFGNLFKIIKLLKLYI